MKIRDGNGNVLDVSRAFAMRMVEQGTGTIVREDKTEASYGLSADGTAGPEGTGKQDEPGTAAGQAGKKAGKRK